MESNTCKTVIISPFSRKTHLTAKESPKNAPRELWKTIIDDLRAKGIKTTQLGVDGEEDLLTNEFIKNAAPSELLILLKQADLSISVDNWLPHFCHFYKINKNIVLWGKSNPEIFGYQEFTNLYKDKKYFRIGREQYKYWQDVEYQPEAFVSSQVVLIEIYNKLCITI